MNGTVWLVVGTLLLVGAWVAQLTVGWWVPAVLVVLGVTANTIGIATSRSRAGRTR